ncbi:MAG: DUF5703 domain-containing protein [Verrucomicrobiota bacterium]|nr:DUF5703 domain-containing protein [Verrucomicrobiota bacterium]
MIRICLSLLFLQLVSLAVAKPEFVNLAASAKITASSESEGQKLAAGAIADGRIAPALSQHLEFYPNSQGAKSWAVNGEVTEDKGELVLEWKEPVMVQEIVYFGRTTWLLEECFKDYEIFVDDQAEPVAKGAFEKRHGGQRVTIERRAVRKLTLRFLNSHGGPNPGAAEILVLDEKLSDAALAALAPAKPPVVKRPPDPISDAHIVWNTPGGNAEGAMPIGNGSLLAHVWADQDGIVHVGLGARKADGRIAPVGGVRFRLEQGFHTAESSFHQALRFKFGEVTVRSLQQPEKPVFSFFVDANRDVLHLQLRTAKPVDFVVGLEGDGEHKALKDHKRLRIRNADHALVVLCDGMEPGEGLELRNPAPATAFDLQVHLLREVPKVEKLDETLGGIGKVDVNGSVSGQMDVWNKFWNRGSIHLGSDEEAAAISRALVLRRYLSAVSGRGPHPLKPASEPAKEVPERELVPWTREKSEAAIAAALAKARPALEVGQGKARFPRFWGSAFANLPAESDPIDGFMDTLQSMLLGATGKRVCVLPGWPVDQDVVARVDCETGLGVEVACVNGRIERLEVYPKQRTSEVFGIGAYAAMVKEILPGSFRMPAIISFLGPGWVGPRVGHDNLFASMKKMNFNGLEGSLADLEATREAGIYLLVHGVTPWAAYTLKDEQSVICYYLSDRRKPGSFPRFGTMRGEYEAIDAYHPTAFTTYAQYGGIEFFLDAVRPRMLEYYDYHWQRQAHLHFHYLEYYRRMSLAAGGIPIFRFVHVHGDNVIKMRQTVSMSLAYGVKAFKWWVGWTMFDIHKVVETEPPPLSDIGREVGRCNNTMAAFSPSLVGARSVAVYHTAPLPASTREAPGDYWVRPSGEYIVMGVFEGARGERFIALGNRDIGEPRMADVTVEGRVRKVRWMDKGSRQWKDVPVREEGGVSKVSLEIDKGDIELLEVVRE